MVFAIEGAERVFKPETREYAGGAMAWTDDVKHIEIAIPNEFVEVSVDEAETRAGTPVAKETILDVVKGEIPVEKDVVLEEYHGCL